MIQFQTFRETNNVSDDPQFLTETKSSSFNPSVTITFFDVIVAISKGGVIEHFICGNVWEIEQWTHEIFWISWIAVVVFIVATFVDVVVLPDRPNPVDVTMQQEEDRIGASLQIDIPTNPMMGIYKER